jgi:hypothetical protein
MTLEQYNALLILFSSLLLAFSVCAAMMWSSEKKRGEAAESELESYRPRDRKPEA